MVQLFGIISIRNPNLNRNETKWKWNRYTKITNSDQAIYHIKWSMEIRCSVSNWMKTICISKLIQIKIDHIEFQASNECSNIYFIDRQIVYVKTQSRTILDLCYMLARQYIRHIVVQQFTIDNVKINNFNHILFFLRCNSIILCEWYRTDMEWVSFILPFSRSINRWHAIEFRTVEKMSEQTSMWRVHLSILFVLFFVLIFFSSYVDRIYWFIVQ